jgi:hypothetical protein
VAVNLVRCIWCVCYIRRPRGTCNHERVMPSDPEIVLSQICRVEIVYYYLLMKHKKRISQHKHALG